MPSKKQEELLSKHFGCARFVYNHFLKEKQEHYLKNKKTSNYHNCSSTLTNLKKQNEYKWLKEVNSQSLQASLKALETAYGSFFLKRTSFPRYKRKTDKNSYTCPQFVRVENNIAFIPKFKEGIKFIKHRSIHGKICYATISKSKTNKYYISFTCEMLKPTPLIKSGKSIGLDLGIKDFIITSEGNKFNNPRFLKTLEQKLNKQKKNFSRKQKDSKRKERQRIKVARIYEKITNSKDNMQHQISSKLVKNYDLIAIEDLNVKGIMANHKLAKAVSDVAWSSFVTKLKYKAQWYGKDVVVIDRFFPSSKTCNCCGHIKESLSLNERSWVCPKCNTLHDRDINASKNILQRALTIKSSGIDDYRHGVEIRPKTTKMVKGINNEVSKKKRIYTLKP